MWEWFFSNAMWFIIVSLVVLAFFFFSLRRQIRQNATEVSRLSLSRGKVLSLGLWAAGSVGLVIAVTALIASVLIWKGTDIVAISATIQDWLIGHGLPTLVIIIIAFITYQVINITVPGIIEKATKAKHTGDEQELARRSQTLTRIVVSGLGITVTVTAVFMVLAEIAPNITPVIAGIGFAGLAIGLGVQSLVKDIVNGLFIIMEDQYRKGDVVTIAGLSGLVEDLSLRRTVLRDRNGTVHTIPNGQIVTASNLTKDVSRINIDIPVAYHEDVDRVMAVINRVGLELAEDPNYRSSIMNAPRALYVDGLSDKGVIIKVLGDTKPLRQWEVAGEFRRRVKIAFDKEGIAIPWAYGGVFSGGKADNSAQTCGACGFLNPLTNKYCANCGSILRQA
jgi:small conductance mechanosensitive channel